MQLKQIGPLLGGAMLGPRELATALFAPLVMETLSDTMGHFIKHIAINAVWISAILHGVTAASGARWYAKTIGHMGPCAETTAETSHELSRKEVS